MRDIIIRRLRTIPIYHSLTGEKINNTQKYTILSELYSLGYNVVNPEMLRNASTSILLNYKEILRVLTEMRGGHVNYVPLFQNFPDIPNDREFFMKRFIGYFGQALGMWGEAPEWLFDLDEFGADPIWLRQNAEAYAKGVKKEAAKLPDEHKELTSLILMDEAQAVKNLQNWMNNCFYSNSSLKEDVVTDLMECVKIFGVEHIDPTKVKFKETKALLAKLAFVNKNSFAKYLDGATDVLRMFAAVTNGDTSLAEPIKFPRCNRKQRREILGVLERDNKLEENLRNYNGLWLRVGEMLHVGEYKNKFPKTSELFHKLRNSKLQTTASLINAKLDNPKELLEILQQNPGVFAKRLHEVLRRCDSHTSIISSFNKALPKVNTKSLLTLYWYLQYANEDTKCIINKKGKIYINSAAVSQVPPDVLKSFQLFIAAELKQRFNNKDIEVSSDIYKCVLPLWERAATDGLLTLSRGSRISIDTQRTLRLFVYWKENPGQRTDLDLSVIQLNQNFEFCGHVSYTNLQADGIIHSGDLTSAPHGAVEFIDISLPFFNKTYKNARYLVPVVYRFHGDTFDNLECFTGWQMRDKCDASRKSFDIKTVANKLDIKRKANVCVPLIVDCRGEIIYADAYFGNNSYFLNNVESSHKSLSAVAKELSKFVERKPTFGWLQTLLPAPSEVASFWDLETLQNPESVNSVLLGESQ